MNVRTIALFVCLTLVSIGLMTACSGDESGPDAALTDEVGFKPKDVKKEDKRVPPPDVRTQEEQVATVDVPDKPDVPTRTDGCGDGLCKGAETPQNCAKDCLEEIEVAAFVFAHKGDELGSLGRIFDLTQAGAEVFVFYLTFDDTPIADYYDDSTAKLSVVTLGVSPQNIYLYEKVVDWDMVSGNHEVLDRLTQHFITIQPDTVYLPQLCGSELEDELAHVIGLWAAKRAKTFPEYFEVPARSNYHIMKDPAPELAATDGNLFVQQFVKRWSLIPKSTAELKPVLGSADMAQIRLAAAHLQNAWFQGFVYDLPEDLILYLLREIQRYRELPPGQKPDSKPFNNSLENPAGTYIYNDQGYSLGEFQQFARVVESFFGTNIRSEPSALPYYDEPFDIKIMHNFDIVLSIRSFSPEADLLTFMVGFGAAKETTEDCETPDDLPINALETGTVTVHCKAIEPVGQHTYYIRAYSQLAKDNNDAAFYTELPFRINVY